MKAWLHNNWRAILSHAPLPMLALAASYGVYTFQLLFVPQWVAFVSAAAFESTYLGLSIVEVPDQDRRRRAVLISIGAVVVSVVYNSASGYFSRNPTDLIGLPWWGELLLAVAHGAPLALIAYLVADLLLHLRGTSAAPAPKSTAVLTHACPQCGAALTQSAYASACRYGHCGACKAVKSNGHLKEVI